MNFSIRRDTGSRIIWSEDQISYIINEYKKTFETGLIAKEFGVSKEAIRSLLKRNGVHVLSSYEYGIRNNPRNIKAFSENTREEAYWLGFLYADGNISDRNKIQINLIDRDFEQLDNFKIFLKAFNNQISKTTKKIDEKIYSGIHFSISDKYIANNLKNRGCVPRKSLILTFPTNKEVEEKYLWDFIRGYFDGDGCISLDKRSNNYLIDFVGTLEFLNGLKEFLSIDNKLTKVGNMSSNTYSLRLSGNKRIKSFLNQMYKNSNEKTRLNRKYQKYLDYINYCA